MIAATVIFWLCVFAMFHSYVLYPLLLRIFAAGKKQNEIVYTKDDAALPPVYIVFAVYNEEKVIREKLESIFNTSYPSNKLKVYIGSDNSSDATNAIVDEYAAKHSQIHFEKYTDRNGKSKILNRLIEAIFKQGIDEENTVLVMTDANVMFTPDTLYHLAKHFKKKAIGQVGANILNRGVLASGISFQEKSYIQRENHIKYYEGVIWGTMMGAFGACHAMRASIWVPIPPNWLMEDFYLSMQVLQQKKSAIKELEAVCLEDVSNEVEEEYKRKTRIQAGNFQNLSVYWPMLFKFNAAAFCFLSHKVIRWLGPIFMLFAYLANIGLLVTICPCMPISQFYLFTFVVQNLLLLSPVLDWAVKKLGIHLKLLRFVAYFYLMNLALVKGFIMYAKGIKTSAWSPTKRNV